MDLFDELMNSLDWFHQKLARISLMNNLNEFTDEDLKAFALEYLRRLGGLDLNPQPENAIRLVLKPLILEFCRRFPLPLPRPAMASQPSPDLEDILEVLDEDGFSTS